MKKKRKKIGKIIVCIFSVVVILSLFAINSFAFDRGEDNITASPLYLSGAQLQYKTIKNEDEENIYNVGIGGLYELNWDYRFSDLYEYEGKYFKGGYESNAYTLQGYMSTNTYIDVPSSTGRPLIDKYYLSEDFTVLTYKPYYEVFDFNQSYSTYYAAEKNRTYGAESEFKISIPGVVYNTETARPYIRIGDTNLWNSSQYEDIRYWYQYEINATYLNLDKDNNLSFKPFSYKSTGVTIESGDRVRINLIPDVATKAINERFEIFSGIDIKINVKYEVKPKGSNEYIPIPEDVSRWENFSIYDKVTIAGEEYYDQYKSLGGLVKPNNLQDVYYNCAYEDIFEDGELIVERWHDVTDLTSWIGGTVGGIFDIEILPNFKLGAVISIILAVMVVIMVLKLFAGG